MISISGIKYQKELEALPYFGKAEAKILIDKEGRNLDKKISQLVMFSTLFTTALGEKICFLREAVVYECFLICHVCPKI